MPDSEKLLVERLRHKDKRAFELVFNQYYGLLKIYALRFMDETEDAEEVVQEVFVRFWEKCSLIAPDSSIKSYLYRSVHNTCLNHLKHQKVKDDYRLYVIQYLEKTVDNSWNKLINKDEYIQDRIMHAINDLPPRCSEIFKLSRIDGLKYQEIADHLNISIKTVEVQMGKALRILRDRLADLNSRI